MASDDFNRPDGGLGANFTTQDTAPNIVGAQVVSGALGGANESALWNNGTWGNDQTSAVTQVVTASSSFIGVTVRASGTGGASQHYLFITNSSSFSALYKLIGNAYTLLVSGFVPPADGSVSQIGVVGNALTAYDDGVAIGSTNDNAIASGNPGIYASGASGIAAVLDNWIGTGDVIAALAALPFRATIGGFTIRARR